MSAAGVKTLLHSQREATRGESAGSPLLRSSEPASKWSVWLLAGIMDQVRYLPAGKRMVPPPTSAQAAIVAAMTAVFLVLPSGTAP